MGSLAACQYPILPQFYKSPYLANSLPHFHQFAPILKIAPNRKIVCKNRVVFCLQVAKLRRQRKQLINKEFLAMTTKTIQVSDNPITLFGATFNEPSVTLTIEGKVNTLTISLLFDGRLTVSMGGASNFAAIFGKDEQNAETFTQNLGLRIGGIVDKNLPMLIETMQEAAA